MSTNQLGSRHDVALANTLAAAGMVAFVAGGCAMTDGKSYFSESGQTLEMRALPFTVREAQGADGRYALGKYYFYQGRLAKAEKAFLEAVRLDSTHVDALNGLGATYDRLGKFSAAEKAYRAALRVNPSASHVWANLGYSRLLAGHGEQAIEPLRQALVLDSGNASARQHLQAANAVGMTTEYPAAAPESRSVTTHAEKMEKGLAEAGGPATPAIPPKEAAESHTLDTPAGPAQTVADLPQAHPSPSRQPGIVASLVNTAAADKQSARLMLQVIPRLQTKTAADRNDVLIEVAGVAEKADQPVRPQNLVARETYESEGAPMPKADAVTATLTTLPTLRIEISNGNGVTGMARSIGRNLRETGHNVARITNARPFDRAQTIIQFNRRFRGEAAELARALPATPRLVASDVAHRGVDVRVVLGADSAMAMRQQEGNIYRVATLTGQ